MPVGCGRKPVVTTSSAGYRTDHHEGVGSGAHGVGERGVRGFVREVTPACEETYERSSPVRSVVADRAPQHRVTRLQSVQHRVDRHRLYDFEFYLGVDSRQRPQVRGGRPLLSASHSLPPEWLRYTRSFPSGG